MAAGSPNQIFSGTGLANGTAIKALPGSGGDIRNAHWKDHRWIVRVAATGSFRLNLIVSPDDGTTEYVVKQQASAAVTVDGNTASYTNAAELDIPVPYCGSVELYNSSGGSIDYVVDAREYYAS